MIDLIVKCHEGLHYKIKITFFPPDLFKTTFTVLTKIIPKCAHSAKQVLWNWFVQLHSE